MSSLLRITFWQSVRRPLLAALCLSKPCIPRRYINAAAAQFPTPAGQSKTPITTKLPNEPCREHFRAFLGSPIVFCFFEKQTSTWQYLVADPVTLEAVVIDPVLDYDNTARTISTATADCILTFIKEHGLKVLRILETHAHADHLSASQYFKAMLPNDTPLCIGKRIKQVQRTFAPRYGIDPHSLENAFDILLEDDEEFQLGDISCKVIHLPGHTPDHVGYVLGKNVFTGDSIFLPDVGSARADFPGGNAKDLYSSMQRLLALPRDYKLFVGHDYPPDGRQQPVCMATVGEQRQLNKHGKTGITEEEFIKFREDRDATLGEPTLLHPSLKVNIRAGRIPPPDESGKTHI